jgi:predicted Fe-Mo cluster-binding NifX family protein
VFCYFSWRWRRYKCDAYESIKRAGIRPVVTDMANIDEVVQAYIEGRLVDHTEKLH